MTPEEQQFRSFLAEMTAEERARAYVQLNCWKWPDALAESKPGRWDALTLKERYNSKEVRGLWKLLKEMTTDFERSRAWWLIELGRTESQHLTWWQSKPPLP